MVVPFGPSVEATRLQGPRQTVRCSQMPRRRLLRVMPTSVGAGNRKQSIPPGHGMHPAPRSSSGPILLVSTSNEKRSRSCHLCLWYGCLADGLHALCHPYRVGASRKQETRPARSFQQSPELANLEAGWAMAMDHENKEGLGWFVATESMVELPFSDLPKSAVVAGCNSNAGPVLA